VLNTEQQQWLTGPEIRFRESKVKLTAHWPEEHFRSVEVCGAWPFPFDRSAPVLLYAGRISKEKGVLELPAIFAMIREVIPEAQMVVAGTGPAEAELREHLPEAHFTGWIDHEKLPDIYRSADLMIFPSRFDTFSCVVLESLSCGTPVVAYNTKGPRDILGSGDCGYLAETSEEMAGFAVRYFLEGAGIAEKRLNAARRSEDYQAGPIMRRLMHDIGMAPTFV
jgi:glycosyltransferase involved in cell wall biosynthesis